MDVSFEERESRQEEDRMKFYPIQEKGVYAVKLCDTDEDAILAVQKLTINHSRFLDLNAESIFSSLIMPSSFRGKAKINEDDGDIYDEIKGRDLAIKRCMNKYQKSFDKRIQLFYNDLKNLTQAIEHYCSKRNIELK